MGPGGRNERIVMSSIEDEITKMDKLAKINASARYELLNANQQLLDFHLNVRLYELRT